MTIQVLKKSIAITVLSLLGLGLGACSSDLPPPPCPEIQILGAAAKLTRFKPGPGRDIIDVMHDNALTQFLSGCIYDIDETGAGELSVYLAPTIQSTRGPAFSGNVARMEYFIIVSDTQKNLLDEQRFPIEIAHAQNLPQVTWSLKEPNTLRIPLRSGQTGEDFQVFIGLQLTRDELKYHQDHP